MTHVPLFRWSVGYYIGKGESMVYKHYAFVRHHAEDREAAHTFMYQYTDKLSAKFPQYDWGYDEVDNHTMETSNA